MFACESDRQEHLRATVKLVETFDKEIMPTLFTDLDGKPSVIVVPFPDDDTKDGAKQFVMDLIRNNRITAFCFVCESYMTKLDKTDESLNSVMQLPPQERPATKEVVMVQFCNAKETFFYFADIVKLEDGKRTLSKWESMKDWNIGGRFGNIWSDAISVLN